MLNYVYMYVSVWVCHLSDLQGQEKGFRFPGAGVKGGCWSPNTGSEMCLCLSGEQ